MKKYISRFAVQKIAEGDWVLVNLLSGDQRRPANGKILKTKKEALDYKETLDVMNKFKKVNGKYTRVNRQWINFYAYCEICH